MMYLDKSQTAETLVAELSVLYELSSFWNCQSMDALGHTSMEKAQRLFGVRRFALWSGPPDERTPLCLSGFRSENAALDMVRQPPEGAYVAQLGLAGDLGLLLLERSSTISARERRLYAVFAGRVESCLLWQIAETERLLTLEALTDSEERYRAILEHAGVAFWVLDDDCTILQVNRRWEELTGYARSDVVRKKKWTELVADPAELEWMISLHKKRRENPGLQDSYEYHLAAADGRLLTLWTDVTLLPGTRQSIASLVDVTQFQSMQRELARSEQRFRSLFEQSIDPLFMSAVDGTRIDVNQAWLDLFGYSREELESLRSIDLYVHPEERAAFLERIQRDGSVRDEVLHRKKDGSPMLLQRSVVARRAPDGSISELQGIVRDITAARDAEFALQRSELEYRGLFEQSIDAIYVVDVDGSSIRANQAWMELFGYTQEEMATLNAADAYVNPSDRESFLKRITAEGSIEDEVRFKKKDGTVFLCARRVVAIRNEDGAIVRFQGIHRDVTASRAAEQALRKSEREYRALFEQSRDALYLATVDGALTNINSAGIALFGYSREEALRLHVSQLYARPEQRDEMVRLALENNGFDDCQLAMRKRDGTVFECEATTALMRDSDGTIRGFQTLIRDVTERKRAEEALRRSEAEFRSLFEQSLDAVYLVDLNGTLRNVNRAGLNLFGYTRHELVGANVTVLYADPDTRADVAREALGSHGLTDYGLRMRHKEGHIIDCFITATLIEDQEGNATGFQSVIRDVTQQKRDREQLERSQEELRRLAAHLEIVREDERAAIAGELHDEVVQALSALGMCLESIRLCIQDTRTAEARDLIEKAQRLRMETAERLRRLHADLRPGMLEDLGLAATIEWTTNDVASRAGIAPLLEGFDGYEGVAPDAAKAMQVLAVFRVFRAALDNVIRHSGARTVKVRLSEREGSLDITVEDDGRGITDEQVRSASSLGIVGMRERINACGGTLAIKGTQGKGTEVRITVPWPDA